MENVYALGIASGLVLIMELIGRWKGTRRALARKAPK